MAGQDWMCDFLMSNIKLSLRTPESTILGRDQCFNITAVGKFFEI